MADLQVLIPDNDERREIRVVMIIGGRQWLIVGRRLVDRIIDVEDIVENNDDREPLQLVDNIENNAPNPVHEILAIPGKQEGSVRFICQNQLYYRSTQSRGILRCANRSAGCKSKIIFNEDGTWNVVNEHTGHVPPPYLTQEIRMHAYIKNQARGTTCAKKIIWEEAARRFPYAASNYITKKRAFLLIDKIRENIRPEIPNTLNQFQQLARNHLISTQIFKATVAGGGRNAIIWMHDSARNYVQDSTTFLVNANFKIQPYFANMDHLLVIDAMKHKETFPVFFVFMETTSSELYEAIFEKIKQLIPEFGQGNGTFITTAESNLLSVIAQKFPRSTIHLSQFYVYQMILQYWFGLGLAEAPTNALWKCLSLVNVPPASWDEALAIIVTAVDNLNHDRFPNGLRLTTFCRQSLKPLANFIAVENQPEDVLYMAQTSTLRTRNNVISPKLNIWEFSECLHEFLIEENQRFHATLTSTRNQPKVLTTIRSELQRIRQLKERFYRLREIQLCGFMEEIMHIPRQQYIQTLFPPACIQNLPRSHWDLRLGPSEMLTIQEGRVIGQRREVNFLGPRLDPVYGNNNVRNQARRQGRRRRRVAGPNGAHVQSEDED